MTAILRRATSTDECLKAARTLLAGRKTTGSRVELTSYLDHLVPAAIDLLYTERDNGGNMHSSAAAIVVMVLEEVSTP